MNGLRTGTTSKLNQISLALGMIATYYFLLYSWRFSRYSAPIPWLVHGHMTPNNETVSRQMP